MAGRAPVFYDPQQKRWPRLRRLFFLVLLVLSALFSLLLISVLIQPVLPEISLPVINLLPARPNAAPPAPQPLQSPPQVALRKSKDALEQARKQAARNAARSKPAPPAKPAQTLSMAYYVNWDEASRAALQTHINQLDVLIPEWLHVSAADGALKEDDPVRQRETLEFIRANAPSLIVVPLLNNCWDGVWQGEPLVQLLQNTLARGKLIQAISEYLRTNHLAGVCVDFEELPAKRAGVYERFMAELATALHRDKLRLVIHLPLAGTNPMPPALLQQIDYVILMGYNQHWSTGTPGPIAGQNWFTEQLEARKADIPPEKMILALGTFGYDWTVGAKAGEPCTFEEAIARARSAKARIRYDPESLNPTFNYQDEAGRRHNVWLLDAVSAFNQIAATRNLHPKAIALWRLGGEDPSLWTFFGKDKTVNVDAARRLEQVQFGLRVDHAGEGEIVRLGEQSHVGRRKIDYDEPTGTITSASYEELPSPCVLSHFGAASRKIALTFDDGPDPRYTPAVLDILRRTGAPATFFILGMNGERYPDLLQRIVDEGHEVGNHTFTHPNLADASPLQFETELSATQRLLESVVYRQTLLFRAPYAAGDDPSTANELQVVTRATQQGYLMVGMHLDPRDWERPGAEKIVQRALEQAEKGVGSILLLHDSGGDRDQTVAALPQLIETLRGHGFELVTVSNLLGRSRDEVMPPLSGGQWHTWANRVAFGLVNQFLSLIYWLFIGGTVLGMARLLFIGALAVWESRRRARARYRTDYRPFVAVIVPAFNEEKVIAQTIRSLLSSDYPGECEIVVVDDGSKDNTYAVAHAEFGSHPRVRVFSTTNSGKSAALNFGLLQTKAEIVIGMDADTIFAPDTISKLVRHFAAPGVAAVAGNAKVGNRINLLTRWQALEYITSQNLDRRAFSALNCITVVPGAVGAWRRKLVLEARGFTRQTLAEDADLTLSLRRLGYSIVNEDEAIAYTEAPDTIKGFTRQRYRWMFGTLQAAWKHKDTLFRPRYGSLGFIALPNIFIFQVLFPLVSPVMDLLTIGSLLSAVFSGSAGSGLDTNSSLGSVVFYYAIFVLVDFLAALLAFVLEPREDKGLLIWLFWQRFFYRQLMYYVAIKSTLATLRGVEVGWGKIERKATVQAQQ